MTADTRTVTRETLAAALRAVDPDAADPNRESSPGAYFTNWADAILAALPPTPEPAAGLREALIRFGRHTNQCRATLAHHDEPDCNCGLRAALAETPGEREHKLCPKMVPYRDTAHGCVEFIGHAGPCR